MSSATNSWLVIVIVGSSCLAAVGCPTPPQSTCPTERVTCACAELEQRAPVEEVATRIKAVRDLSDPSLRGAIAAATDLERFCRDDEGLFLPPRADRDATWRQRCSSGENALPGLLRALDAMEARREPGHENREQENSLATGIVSALGNIQLGNPESVCRPSVVAALISALETPDSVQDFRVNVAALRILGEIGDDRAIPVLIRAMFTRSERGRPVFLQEPARAALLQQDDLEAVTTALIRAGRMENSELNAQQAEDDSFDVRTIKEQVARTLGEIGIASPAVISYLMAELNHSSADAVDRAPARGGRQLDAQRSRALRRSWAAMALGRLRHQPALPVILPRLELREDGGSVDSSVDITEIPGYLDAIGDFLLPETTDAALLTYLERGDQVLGERAARRLSLQASTSTADRLAQYAAQLPACEPGERSCFRNDMESIYIAAMRGTAGCTTVPCLAQRASSSGTSDNVRIRAAYQLAMLAHGDAAASNQAREALLAGFDSDNSELIDACAWAIDRVSPAGCDEACLGRLDTFIEAHRGAAVVSSELRTVMSLRSRLRYRASQ